MSLFTRFLSISSLAAASLAGVAQVPLSQQLDLLEGLSASERAALVQRMGVPASDEAVASDRVGTRGVVADTNSLEASAAISKEQEALKEYLEGRLKQGDSVLVEFGMTEFEEIEDLKIREYARGLVERVGRRNPFRVLEDGVLLLPGLAPIPVEGLTAVEASRRLSAVPALRDLKVKVTRLPLTARGLEALKPFGYDFFLRSPSTFAPINDVPIPSDYLVGPGDQLTVLLFGSQNRTLRLVVGRDGQLNFPELGPIPVGGKPFSVVREDIEGRVARQLIGVQASVGLGDTRSIRVFVAGEATKPGSYTVSGLATIISALYAAGGIGSTGSLRDIQLKRQGAVIRRLDVYDVLLKGDTTGDVPLRSGDVVFVPPVGETVTVDGAVRRPAIYEIAPRSTVADVVALAGGVSNEADLSRVTVLRLDEQRRRVALDRPLEPAGTGLSDPARDGDVINVARVRPNLDSGVRLEGHVHQALTVAWREELRISAVIPTVDDLKPNADLRYVLIVRESLPDRRRSAVSVDLVAAWQQPGSAQDVLLAPRDRVIVFDADADRAALLAPVLSELGLQGDPSRPSAVVGIRGAVRHPGQYPLEPGMRVSDLVRAGGALTDAAYPTSVEITRDSTEGGQARTEVIEVDLAAVRRGEAERDVSLQPLDVLTIKEVANFGRAQTVVLRGEVRFPGTYVLRQGETLRSVIDRAGGFSSLAFLPGAVFTRAELREREAQRIQQLTERLQADLAASAIQAQGSAESGQRASEGVATALGLLKELKSVKPVGRLVVDLYSVISSVADGPTDVLLRDGDELVIPKVRQEVTVLGEVQNGTSHLYREGLDLNDYIDLSGGLTERAAKGRVYVVRADGSVATAGSRGLFARSGGRGGGIQPGDTIVAPLDTDRLPKLPLWQAITTIIYNSAVALAAIQTL